MIAPLCNDLDGQTTCSRDISSDLSDFVDSLLASDASIYAVNYNSDTVDIGTDFFEHDDAYFASLCDQSPLSRETDRQPVIALPSTSSSVRSPKRKHIEQPIVRQATKAHKSSEFASTGLQDDPVLKPVRRTITNNTYLRRLYLSPEQALRLFPDLDSCLLPIKLSRQVRATSKPKEAKSKKVDLLLDDGRRWPTLFECVTSSNGQLHCRLVNGWSKFCRDNDVFLHDSVVMEPSDKNANEIHARIERRAL